MKIALTVNFSPWSAYSGGGQRSTHRLASALAARGHDVTVVYTKPPWERLEVPRDLPYRAIFAALVSRRSRSGAPLRVLTAITVARAIAKLGAIDVVHCQGEEGALIRTRARLVVTPRYPSYPRLLIAPKYLALGVLLARADALATTSAAALASVERAYRRLPAQRTVVPNGVDATFLEVERDARASAGPVVFFGRIEHSKGLDTLLAAMRGIDRELVVIGRGAMEGEARAYAAVHDLRVRFHEWAPPSELARVLASASVVALPSREESFGNVMVEAMAAGAPLVSTTAGSIPEIAIDGETARLVAPGSEHALREAIAGLLADPGSAEALGGAGRRHVRDRFSWDASAAAFEALYVR